jgi:hypothetical protein
MAVKVMVASAITRGALEKPALARKQGGHEPARPRRRRASVYDADGNEVFITLLCLKCHKMRPLSQFGLRKMADGAIRNQPWCRTCRSGAGEKARPRDAETIDPPAAPEPAASAEPQPAEAPRRPSGAVATEVAAALAAGLRR